MTIEIPPQLRNPLFRFIKLKPKSKTAIETDWPNTKNYSWDSKEIQEHLKQGGNYGVLCGRGGLVVLDADTDELEKAVLEYLEKTFKVKTGSGKTHFYFTTDNLKKIVFRVGSKHCGELQGNRTYVVGPNCIHPKGNPYTTVDDGSPIAHVSADKITNAVKDFLPKDDFQQPAVHKEFGDSQIRISDIIPLSKLKKRTKDEYQGPHPVHESERTGQNFTVNTLKNVAFCFRHNRGGGPLYWIAVLEKIISCGDDLRGEDFKKTLSIAREKYGLKDDTEKRNELKNDLFDLLDAEEQTKNFLDIGVVDNRFYYGKKIGGKDAIILSDGEVLRNTEEKIKTEGESRVIGENQIRKLINYSSCLGDIASRWSNKGIKEFLQGKSVDRREMYEKVYDRLDYFMDYGLNQYTPVVQACWTLATYTYPLYYWFPHLFLNGPTGSGKSKNALILQEMAFGGFDLGASAGVTPAQIFRTLEENRGTIVIDEFERRDKSETQQLVLQILNASATRDSYIIRIEKIGERHKAWKFPIFGPKITCNITGVNPTTLSRFITCHLIRSNDSKSKRKPQAREELDKLHRIRDDLHIWGLQYWNEVNEAYKNIDLKLTGREEDNWLPICSVAKVIGSDVFSSILKFIDSYEEYKVETSDIEADFFLTLLDIVPEKTTTFTAREIAGNSLMTNILNQLKLEYPDRWVGRTLTKFKYKSKHKSGGTTYFLDKQGVEKIVNLYFNPEKSSQTSLVSEMSLMSEVSKTPLISQTSQDLKKNENEPTSTENSVKNDISDSLTFQTERAFRNEEFTLLEDKYRDFAKCEYCGEIRHLKYRDSRGHHACSICALEQQSAGGGV